MTAGMSLFRCALAATWIAILTVPAPAQTSHNPRSVTAYKPFNQYMSARYGRKHAAKKSTWARANADKAAAAWAWHTRGMRKSASWPTAGRRAWARHNAGMTAAQNRALAEAAWRRHTRHK